MTTFSVSMCKDEADVAEPILRQMASQVDRMIVADNGSTDGTLEILHELAKELPLEVRDDSEVAYYQSEKMTALAMLAADAGADWVVPHDFDEFWYSPFGRIADVLAETDAVVATAEVYDHRCTCLDPVDGNPVERMGYRTRNPIPLHKVACRPLLPVTITQGNHGAHYPNQSPLTGQLVIRHFPLRSVEQMVRKARNGGKAYEATTLPDNAGAHWRQWNQLSDEQLADVFRTHYFSDDPDSDNLMFDPCAAL